MIGSTRYVAAAEIGRQTQLSADISKLQQSISSNKRLSAGSDDAAAAGRIAEIRQTQADHLVWARNAASGQGIAAAADTTLATVANLMTRAKELVLAGGNQTNNATDRATYAQELRGIADDLDGYAKATDPNGNALFPSTAPTAIPIGDGLNVAATASKAEVFDTVTLPSGTKSLSSLLRDTAGALNATDTIPVLDANGDPMLDADGNPVTQTRAQAITGSVADIDAGIAHVTTMQTDQGLRAQRFDDAKARLASGDTDLATERSGLEDTDLTYAVSAFQAKQLALQAAQTVYAQAHKSSLFSLLG